MSKNKNKYRQQGPPKPEPAPSGAPACSIVAEAATPVGTDASPTHVEPETHDDPPPRETTPAVTEPVIPAATGFKQSSHVHQHGWGTTILCSLIASMFAWVGGMATIEVRNQKHRPVVSVPLVKPPTEAELLAAEHTKALAKVAREEDLADLRAERTRKRRRLDAEAEIANADLYRNSGLLPRTVTLLPKEPVYPEPAPKAETRVVGTVPPTEEKSPGPGAPPPQVPDPAPPEVVTPSENKSDAVSELPDVGSVPDTNTARLPRKQPLPSSRRRR